jgi:cell division protein FtsL
MNPISVAVARVSSHARNQVALVRDTVPTAEDPNSVLLVRAGHAAILILLTMFATIWMRLDSRDAARELQLARDQLAAARQEQRQLLVERAMLRDPARLREVAHGMGLTPPRAVVHVGPSDPALPAVTDDVEATP